jgi:lipopolysaccharide transport protein LptA
VILKNFRNQTPNSKQPSNIHFQRVSVLKFGSWFLLGVWSLVFGVWVQAQVSSLGKVIVKGFENKVFYPAPNLNQVKSVIKGGQGQPLTNNQVALTKGVVMQTFRPKGEAEMRLEAADCIYDAKARSAFSSGHIKAASGDEKYTIAGEGFLWMQTNSSFFISNNVHSTVQASLSGKSSRTNTSENRLDIFSDRFNYDGKIGEASYQGNLRVAGTNLALTSEILKIRRSIANTNELETLVAETNVILDYEQIHATSQRAVYTTASNLVQLFGEPKWRAGQREGSGDEVSVDLTNKILRATGNAYLKMPASGSATFLAGKNLSTNRTATTNRFIQITSDNYTIQTNRAVFNGNVRATEIVGDQPLSKLSCSMLLVEFSGSNEVQRVVAELGVVIEQHDNKFTADSALYTATNGVLLLRGSPSWRAGSREGGGDELRVDAAKEQMRSNGKAWMKLPAGEMTATLPSGTNAAHQPKPAPGTNIFAKIFSDEYTIRTNHAEFLRNVRVDHPQLGLTCGKLNAKFTGTTAEKEVVAEDNVLMDLMDGKGQKIRGSGNKAVYSYAVSETATNDLVVLSGNPKLEFDRGTWSADVLTLNRATGTVSGPRTKFITKPGARILPPKAQ